MVNHFYYYLIKLSASVILSLSSSLFSKISTISVISNTVKSINIPVILGANYFSKDNSLHNPSTLGNNKFPKI